MKTNYKHYIIPTLLIVWNIAKGQDSISTFQTKFPTDKYTISVENGDTVYNLIPEILSLNPTTSQATNTRKTSTKASKVSAYAGSYMDLSHIPESYAVDKSKDIGEIPIIQNSTNGALGYSVPIEVYQAANGMNPSIQINYSSMAGNGVVGYGWNIGGLSMITMVNKNIYFDGRIVSLSLINDVNNWVFELDGQRLIWDSSLIGDLDNLNCFKTEQGNIRAEFYKSGNIVKYFNVYYPDGSVATYGFENNTSVKLNFPLTKLKDKVGNKIEFTYNEINDIYYIDRIDYGGKEGTSQLNNYASIRFFYENRSDITTFYFNETENSKYKRLESISCYFNQKYLRGYEFEYDNTNYSMLKQIDCESYQKKINPLRFFYGENNQLTGFNKNDVMLTTFFNNALASKLILERGRFNSISAGYGLISYPKISTYGLIQTKSNFLADPGYKYGSTYHPDQPLLVYSDLTTSLSTPVILKAGAGFQMLNSLDVDGDGKDELVKVNSSVDGSTNEKVTYSVYDIVNYLGGFFASPRYSFDLNCNAVTYSGGLWSPANKKYLVGDFNGDGKQSIMSINYNKDFLNNSVSSTAYLIDIENKSQLKTTFDGIELGLNDKIYVMDFNGDGKDDIIKLEQSVQTTYITEIDGTRRVETNPCFKLSAYDIQKKVEFGNSLLFSCFCQTNIDYGEVLLGDLNIDGKTDIVILPKQGYWVPENNEDCGECDYCRYYYGTQCENPIHTEAYYVEGGNEWSIYYSMGSVSGFHKKVIVSASYNADTKFILQDMNGDDKSDLVANNNGLLQFYANVNGKFNSNAEVQTFSLSGGSQAYLIPEDIKHREKSLQLFSISDYNLSVIKYNCNISSDRLLTGMVTSTGIVNKNQYSNILNDYSNYNNGTKCQYPYRNLSGNLFLHASTESFISGNRISSISKNYTRGINDLRGKGFLGFEQIQTYDEMRNTSFTQIFDPVNFGTLKSIDSPMASATYNYNVTVETNKIAKVTLSSKIETDKLSNVIVNSSYTYDGYGNPTKEIRDYSGGLKVTTDNLYNNWTTSPYILGELYQQTITSLRNGQTATEKTYIPVFDSNSRQPVVVVNYKNDNQVSDIINTYDNGRLTKESRKDFTATSRIETSYNYDSFGRLSKKINPLGLSEDYGYDTYGRLETITDHKNHITTFGYDEWGRKISTTNPDGSVQTISMQWIGSSETNSGSSTTTNYGVTNNNYNKDIQFLTPMSTGTTIAAANSITLLPGYSFGAATGGNLKLWIDKTVSVSPPTISGGSSSSEGEYMYLVTNRTTGAPATQSYIDALGREVRNGSMRFDGNYLYADKEYDIYGRLSRVSLPFKGSSPSLWNSYTYDDYDRPLSVTYASGKTDNFSYSGLSASSTIDGITKTTTKDATGKVISVTDPAGKLIYNFRPDGQPSSIVAPGNVTTSFEYDDYGRQTKLIDPSAGTRVYAYDDTQSIISETDDRGKIIKSTTDKYNRITQKEIVGELTTTYNYNTDGQLETVSSNNGTGKNLTYDGFLRLSTVKDIAPDGKYLQKDLSYSAGIPTAISYSTQNGTIATENYGYAYGTQTEIKLNNSTSVWKLTAENDMGQASVALTGNLTREYGYDMYGLPTARMVKSGTNVIQDFGFNINATTGNLNWRKDNTRNLQENFGYDNLNRLNTFGGNTISYNVKGNITNHTSVGSYDYGITAKPYTLTTVTPYGDAIPMRTQDISYNGMQRPSSISENGYSATFAYDQSGQRVKMQLANNGLPQLTRYYIGGQYELDAEAGTERLYLGGDAYSAASVYVKEAGTWKIYYICRDYQGSITHVVNADGSLKQELSYDPWGRLRNPVTQQVYVVDNEPTLFLARGYTGHEHLTQFGLINMNARLYDAALGRFLSPDPYVQSPGNSQNFNRYSYCLNNPLRYTDPSGMSFKSWWNRNIAKPFMREWEHVFGNGQGGFQLGYNSSGGFFANPTYNGASFGPSAYYNTSNRQFSFGNGSGGFHDNSSSVRLDRIFASSVAQAEQFAKDKFNDYKSLAANYSSNMSDWFENHFLFETEIRFDYGKQVALHGRVLGFDVLGGYNKGTKPIAQLEIGYKGDGYANIYDPVLHSTYNGITDPIRDSWNAGVLFFGAEGNYYPSNSQFGFENWKSETINCSVFNITKLYNYQGQNYEKQYTGDISFDLALFLGFHFNLRLGYYK